MSSPTTFKCAEDSIEIQSPRLLDGRRTQHLLFIYLAKNVGWLLNHPGLSLSEDELQHRYHNLLLKSGYGYYNGSVRKTELFAAFAQRFDETTLENFGCELKSLGRGWLACGCGFKYQRKSPDSSEADLFRYDSVREYAHVWEGTFSSLWMNYSLSVAQIARILQVSSHMLTRHAIRLNLPMNQEGGRTVACYWQRCRRPRKAIALRVKDLRREWTKHRRKHCGTTRCKLKNAKYSLYRWLTKHDSDWFKKHLPKIVERKKKVGDRHNRKKIDAVLSGNIIRACEDILVATKPFRRVSLNEIISRVGHRNWLERRLPKLPTSKRILDDRCESRESFMLRKIIEMEKEYIAENKVPTASQFETRAVLRNTTYKRSVLIRPAAKHAVNRIEIAVITKPLG